MLDDNTEFAFVPVQNNENVAGSIDTSNSNNTPRIADATSGYYASILHGGFPDEDSLFEELGIHHTDIINNLKVILNPTSQVKSVDNNYLVGLLFFFGFAFLLLFNGSIRFGFVYLIGIGGFTVLYFMFYLMSTNPITLSQLFTAISYCTLPLYIIVIIFALFKPNPFFKAFFGLPFTIWSAYSATRYLMPTLKLESIFSLVFIPLLIFYSYLLLLPLF